MGVWETVVTVILAIIAIAIFVVIFTAIAMFSIIALVPENYNEMSDDEKAEFWEEISKNLTLDTNNDMFW